MPVKIPEHFHKQFDKIEKHGLNTVIVDETTTLPSWKDVDPQSIYYYFSKNKIVFVKKNLKAEFKITTLQTLSKKAVERMIPNFECERCGKYTFNLLLNGEVGDPDRKLLCEECREGGQ